MIYKCLIIDDEPLARELVETYLDKIPNFELVASCPSAIQASSILNDSKIDLLFLDIEMPVLKGTDFFKNLVHKPHVIFTTAYRDYAIAGFELNAVDYLLKPIIFERFFLAIQKFLNRQERSVSNRITGKVANRTNHVFVTKSKKQVKILLNDVFYVESMKDYIKIHFENKILVIKESISSFEKRTDDRFVRIHRSYIVNQDRITAYTKNDVEIGQIEIPIGGIYKRNELSFFKSLNA